VSRPNEDDELQELDGGLYQEGVHHEDEEVI